MASRPTHNVSEALGVLETDNFGIVETEDSVCNDGGKNIPSRYPVRTTRAMLLWGRTLGDGQCSWS